MNRLMFPMCVLAVLSLTSGCIELQETLLGAVLDTAVGGTTLPSGDGVDESGGAGGETGDAGGETGDAGGESGDSGDGGEVPVVRLTVSNPTPEVSEEIRLTCTVTGGDNTGVTFGFQPTTRLLFVDSRAGTAAFIVEQVDIGVEISFTCTATNGAGTSEPSDPQTIFPT